jgi:hypothetical protein
VRSATSAGGDPGPAESRPIAENGDMGSYPAVPPQGVGLNFTRNLRSGFAGRANAISPMTALRAAGCLILRPPRPATVPSVHEPHTHGAHWAEVVKDGRYVTLQMAEGRGVAWRFSEIASLIGRLRAAPEPARSSIRQPMMRLDGGIAVYVVARIGLVRPTERVSWEFSSRRVGRNQNRLDWGNVTCTNGC